METVLGEPAERFSNDNSTERRHIMSTLSAAHAHPLLVLHAKHFHAIDALRTMFRDGTRPERIHYPPSLNSLLEDAAMAREMGRL